jgi:hypothetical protein
MLRGCVAARCGSEWSAVPRQRQQRSAWLCSGGSISAKRTKVHEASVRRRFVPQRQRSSVRRRKRSEHVQMARRLVVRAVRGPAALRACRLQRRTAETAGVRAALRRRAARRRRRRRRAGGAMRHAGRKAALAGGVRRPAMRAASVGLHRVQHLGRSAAECIKRPSLAGLQLRGC